jgi:hypothetical protein
VLVVAVCGGHTAAEASALSIHEYTCDWPEA